MKPFEYIIELTSIVKGSFDLRWINLGYRYSRWWEEGGEVYQGAPLSNNRVVQLILLQDKNRVFLKIRSNYRLKDKEMEELKGRVVFCFGLDEDISPVFRIASKDRYLSRIIKELPGYRLKSTPSIYEALISGIISQNCSVRAFFNMQEEFIKGWGRGERIGSRKVFAFPTLEEILKGREIFKDKRLLYRAKSIKGVVREFKRGFLSQLERLSIEEGVEYLKRLKGVGEYTARITYIYGMRRYNLLFLDGYVQKLMKRLYQITSPKDIYKFTRERWGEWQAYLLDILIAYEQMKDKM